MSLSLDGTIVNGFAKGGVAFVDKSRIDTSLIGRKVKGLSQASSINFDGENDYDSDNLNMGGSSGFAQYPNTHGPTFTDSGTIIGVYKDADDNNTIYVAAQDDNGNLIKFESGAATVNPTWYLTWFKLSDLTLVVGDNYPLDATSKIVNVLDLDSLNSAQNGNAWVLRTNSSIDSSWNGKKVMLIYSYNHQIDNNDSNMLTISEIFRFDGMSPQTVSSVSSDGKIDLFNFAGQFFQISCRTQTNTSDKSEAHGFLLQFAE